MGVGGIDCVPQVHREHYERDVQAQGAGRLRNRHAREACQNAAMRRRPPSWLHPPAAASGLPASGRALGAAVAILALVLAACGGPNPSAMPGPTSTASPTAAPTAPPTPTLAPLPSGDQEAVYRQIEDQVVELRGLAAKERIDPVILSEDELRSRMEVQFRAENTPEEIAVSQGTLVALGLLAPGVDLAALYVDMLGSQVAGFYDPATGKLYVVSRTGAVGALERTTFAHEFTHALQDQHFGLEGIDVDAVGQGDRSLGRLALVEGDATLSMTRWVTSHLTPAELRELLKVDPESQAQLEALPAILRETLLFPYQQGLIFVSGLWARGGWPAVDAAYARLPASTEQILHPDKYAAGEAPVVVPLDGAALAARMGPGWSSTPADTMGEFQLSIWLRENGVQALDAQRAAAGWGGDRIEYLRGPNGAYALAFVTAWDTTVDADEFLAAAKDAMGSLPGAAMVGSDGPLMVRLFAASDQATLSRLGEASIAALP